MKEKFYNLFEFLKKISYIIQFIITLIFGRFLYKLILQKNTIGMYGRFSLIIAIIFGALTIAIMCYHIKKDRKKIEKMFLNLSIFLGIMYMFIIIPGQVPDEQVHMMKAYEVSKGIFITKIQEDGSSHTTIPREMLEYNHNILDKYSKLNDMQLLKTNYEDEAQEVSSAQGYSSVLYLIPALGLFIGRNIGVNLITSIYLGKTLNLILFIVMGYYSIKKIPFGKIAMAIYLLMPMMLHQAGSFSSDVFINSITLYFTAYLLNLLCKKEKITNKELIIYCVLSVLVALAKIVYVPLVGIGLLLILKKNTSRKKVIVFITASIILAVVFALGEYIHATHYTSLPLAMAEYNQKMNVNSSLQIEHILDNPIFTIKTFAKDLIVNGEMYIKAAVGQDLGWLNIKIPPICILAYIILLLYSIIIENNQTEIKTLDKIWIEMICLGIVVLVQMAMYTSFTPIGANFIGGVQGRYFIPILLLQILCFTKKNNYIKTKNPEIIVTTISGVLNIFVLSNIYMFFIN